MNTNDINGISEIKALAIDMISAAKSGHPGIVLSAAPILYTLYTHHMNINPENPEWINRDRFILSAGHGSALLYATLHLCGYAITKEDLKSFRSLNSRCPGHPEYGITPGVDMTTGALGQGIANGVGMALAERYLRNILVSEEEDQELIDFYTYVLCSDGDLMEGISYEATSLAGTQKLNKLILLYDCNKMTNDGSCDTDFIEDTIERFEAIGFNVIDVKNGMDCRAIDKAISAAKKSKKPSLIIFHTILGSGSRNENTSVVHSGPLKDDDVFAIKRQLNVTIAPFELRKDTQIHVQNQIKNRVETKYKNFVSYFNRVRTSGNDRLIEILRMLVDKNVTIPFDSVNYRVNGSYNEDIRMTNHKVLNLISSKTELFLGGSADLASSTLAYIDKTHVQSSEKPMGRNINFGVREHAMAGILNGMAMLGLKVYGSTMLAFSDYLKPSMRISAMLNLPVTYIFSHDSIAIGEDGPTHEPVEQLLTLRSIPNMITFRPCDISEVFGVWEYICKHKKTVSVVFGKKVMPKVPTTNPSGVMQGGYIIKKENARLDGIIIATGSEVATALHIATELQKNNLDLRVVSMPSQELFLQNDKEYQNQILPKNVKRVVIEPSHKFNWGLFVSDEKYILGINDFGYSGHPEEVLRQCEYDYESLKIKVAKLIINQ